MSSTVSKRKPIHQKARKKDIAGVSTKFTTVDGFNMVEVNIGYKKPKGIHKRTILIDLEGSVFTSGLTTEVETSLLTRHSIVARNNVEAATMLLTAILEPVTEADHQIYFGANATIYHSTLRVGRKFFPIGAVYSDDCRLKPEVRERYARKIMDDLRYMIKEEDWESVLTECRSSETESEERSTFHFNWEERTLTIVGRPFSEDHCVRTVRSLDTGLLIDTEVVQ